MTSSPAHANISSIKGPARRRHNQLSCSSCKAATVGRIPSSAVSKKKVRFPSASLGARGIRPFARSRLNGLTSKSKFLGARSQRAAVPLILQLNNDMRSELWQASGGGGGGIKRSNKAKERLPRETMGKEPSGGRGMSGRG